MAMQPQHCVLDGVCTADKDIAYRGCETEPNPCIESILTALTAALNPARCGPTVNRRAHLKTVVIVMPVYPTTRRTWALFPPLQEVISSFGSDGQVNCKRTKDASSGCQIRRYLCTVGFSLNHRLVRL